MKRSVLAALVAVIAVAIAVILINPFSPGAEKALVIIPPNNFNDMEFNAVVERLEEAGILVTIGCSSEENAVGMYGKSVKPDALLGMVDPLAYDAVVFIGGGGTLVYFDDNVAQSIAVCAAGAGKVVAAICVAPVILARAGVLNGKAATVFPMFTGELIEGGAEYTGENVTVDGKIITANGPDAAEEFANEILRALEVEK